MIKFILLFLSMILLIIAGIIKKLGNNPSFFVGMAGFNFVVALNMD